MKITKIKQTIRKQINKKNINQLMNILKHPISIFIAIVISTVFMHWSLVQIYATYCAPWGWLGPFQSFITMGSPMCHFINIIQVELAKHYITIWISAGTTVIAWIGTHIL
jgi:hypothetical protein